MNWEELSADIEVNGITRKALLAHWQKLGSFRNNHVSIGAGRHEKLSDSPYVFKRSYSSAKTNDMVVVGLDLQKGEKTIPVGMAFPEGSSVTDYYSGKQGIVKNKEVAFDTPHDIVLIQK